MRPLLTTLVISILTQIGSGSKILAFLPFGAKSHHILMKPWIVALCERGHQVTYLSPTQFPENVKNLEKIPIPDHWGPHQSKMIQRRQSSWLPNHSLLEPILFYNALLGLANDTLRTPEVFSFLDSNRQYDAVISESAFAHEWVAAVAHRFNAIHIPMITFGGHAWTNEISGLPNNPSYMTDPKYDKGSIPTNILEQLYNLYIQLIAVGVPYFFTTFQQQKLVDELIRYPGWEGRPRLTMLASDNALVLRNTHHSIGEPEPTAPHVKDVGGLNVDFNFDKKPKLMGSPEFTGYKWFMDNSTQGFVYFSMGSLIKPKLHLPPGTFEKIYSALSKIGLNVLMRWNDVGDQPKTPSANIKLYNEFLPQMEILAHKNIKLFVTHGGLLSKAESVNFGVPIYGLPVFGDQPMNVKKAAHHGYGLWTYIYDKTSTETKIISDINELLGNPKYKKEAERRSGLFRDRPMNPVEEAVYWTEYVLKHGKVLQPASVHLPIQQFYLIDVIATLSAAVLLVYMIVNILLRQIIKCLTKRKNGNQKSQDGKIVKRNNRRKTNKAE